MARKTAQKPKDDIEPTKPEAKAPVTPANDPAPPKMDSAPDKAAVPSEADTAPPVEDAELLEMLEHLSKTIDTAQSVLDEQHRMVMDVRRPPLPHLPGLDGGPAPLSHLTGMEQPEPMPAPPKRRSGIFISAATAVFSATLAIGILGAWWLYLNKTGPAALIAKDESRITSSTASSEQLAELPPAAEPPLPSQNPQRQVVAEATAMPVSHAVETSTETAVPAEKTAVIKRKFAPTPYQPVDVVTVAPEQTTSAQTSISKSSATMLTATGADREKPVTAQVTEPKKSSAERAEPEKRTAQRAAPSDGSPVSRANPASAQPQSAPVSTQVSRQSAGSPAKPAQVAGVNPRSPATADSLKPREKVLQPLTKEEEQRILRRGADLARLGDISGARLALEYAAQRGNAQAMYALGQTFDPDYLAERGVVGVAADAEVAMKWYSRAAKLGIDAAKSRVRVLERQAGQRR